MLSDVVATDPPNVFGVPIDFILFGLCLFGIALFHRHTMAVALTGLMTIAIYKITVTGFKDGPGIIGFVYHIAHEWVILTNLFCLLMGFALLSQHVEKSRVSLRFSKYLPHDWRGGFFLLVSVWILSSFLDNIAGALIGGALAHQLFSARVHIGYVAAIVAASNAGGAWSVLGDTTTTMMWIGGVSPTRVFEAIIASTVALFIFGVPAAFQQQKYSPLLEHAPAHADVDWKRIAIVGMILGVALVTNVFANMKFAAYVDHFPFIGAAVWLAILLSVKIRRPDWEVLPEAFKGSIFLLALVLIASMMPVEKLPPPSWPSTFGLGFLSSVFDNIPLTALALKQGGYDWGFLAFTVGFGGSMIWFGSSAGVALSNMYPEAKSIARWLRHGWPIAIAYVFAFFVMLGVSHWHPDTRPVAAVQRTPISGR